MPRALTIFVLLASALAPAAAQPAPAPPAVAAWPFDLRHVRLALDVDPVARTLEGTVTLTLVARTASATLNLGAAKSVAIAAVSIGGRALEFKHDAPTLVIALGEPIAAGATVTVDVRYKLVAPTLGAYFVGPDGHNPDRAPQLYTQSEPYEGPHWFPGYHEPDDKATSEVEVTIPAGYTAISNGSLITARPEGDRQRVLWKQQVPHSTYLIALMVGRFARLELGAYKGIPLTVYSQPQDVDKARRSTERTAAMMAFYEELAGKPFPFAKYAQVMVAGFKWGGMENTSATTLNDGTLHDERAELDETSDPLVAHELSHQWFGDALTCRGFGHLWLNEGFATYCEQLWAGRSLGEDRLARSLADSGDGYLGEEDRGAQPVVRPGFTDVMTLFDSRTYNKGGRVLHMLRRLLGEKAFWDGLRLYVARHWLGSVETDDLRRAMEEASGQDLARFFKQWLLEPGYPHFKITSAWREGALELEVEQIQPAAQAEFSTPVDIAVDVETSPGTRERLVRRFEIPGRKTTLRWELPAEPAYVRFNAGGWLLCRVERAQTVAAWSAQLERDPDVLARREAVAALDPNRGEFAVQQALGRALATDKYLGVRTQAADTLGRAGGTLAASLLLAGERDDSSAVRAAVARGLAHVAQAETQAALRRLADDRSYAVAGAALASLVQHGVADRAELAAKFFGQDSHDERLRRAALAAFATIGDAGHLAKLVAAGDSNGGSLSVRLEAIGLLPRLAGAHGDEVRRSLSSRLADPSADIRRRAAAALSEVGVPATKPLLASMAERDKDEAARKVATEAIAAIDKRHPAKPLADQVKDLEREAAERRTQFEAAQRAAEATETALREATARAALEAKKAGPPK